jgi:putative DNA primase/helicase
VNESKKKRFMDEADLNAAGLALPDPTTDCKLLNPDFWRSGIVQTEKGAPKRCLANVMHVLSLHPDWHRVLAWDAFGLAVVTRKRPPMRGQDAPEDYAIGDWTDEDSARTASWFTAEVGFEPTSRMVDEAVAAVARRHVVHPVRDWLSSLKWDQVERLNGFAASYLGAPESKYAAAVGRRWLIAAVARVCQPGCKVDSLLGLEGSQGIGKSSALRLLAGNEWFADSGIEIGTKDSYQALRRKWIFELAELSSIRGKEIERVKNFLSSQVDTYRASYGRRTQDHPRQVVFAGSTNELHYLADQTGSRRFWPVKCTTVNLAAIKRDRSQLWAEARVAYEAGEPWHLDTPELRALAAEEASHREEEDAWEELVGAWLEAPVRKELASKGVTTSEVLLGALGFAAERITHAAAQRVGRVLRKLGWEPRQERAEGERARRYRPTCDGVCVTSEAEKGSSHSVTHVTDDPCVGEQGKSGLLEVIGKASVPSVTCDTDDIERAAIQEES